MKIVDTKSGCPEYTPPPYPDNRFSPPSALPRLSILEKYVLLSLPVLPLSLFCSSLCYPYLCYNSPLSSLPQFFLPLLVSITLAPFTPPYSIPSSIIAASIIPTLFSLPSYIFLFIPSTYIYLSLSLYYLTLYYPSSTILPAIDPP